MHYSTILTLAAAAASSVLATPVPAASATTTVSAPSATSTSDLKFWIPSFSGDEPSGFFEPGNVNYNKFNFNISLFDVHENDEGLPGYYVGCETSFTLPDYPKVGSQVECGAGWSYYFASYTDIADFTVNIIHSYVAPGQEHAETTYWGFGNPINETTADNQIQYSCTTNSGPQELRTCTSSFNNLDEQIITIPITLVTV